ncbi:hypothetical protein D3C80_206590 [compost metagenome]
MDSDDQEKPVAGKHVDFPDGERPIQRHEIKDVAGYQKAGDEHDQHSCRQTYDGQTVENPDGIAPAFGNRAVPTPVEDVMDDHEGEECSSKQLVA